MLMNSETEDIYRQELSQFLAKNQIEIKVNENLS